MNNDMREILLIATGVANIGIAIYSLIRVFQLTVLPGRPQWMRRILMAAFLLYMLLELDWLGRGLYHASSWMPVLWNLLDGLWMLSVPHVICLRMCPDRPYALRKVDCILQDTLARVEKGEPHAR